MSTQLSEHDNDYFAVRSEMVIAAKDHFRMRTSHLEAGEKRLLLKAQAIASGKDTDRWGHHKGSIIRKFCEATANGESLPLSWWELVEDEDIYDQTEGRSRRTGNRPLGTVQRFVVDAHVLSKKLETSGDELTDWASNLNLPVGLLQALREEKWPSVSAQTADKLRPLLGDDAFSRLLDKPSEVSTESLEEMSDAAVDDTILKKPNVLWIFAGLAAVVVASIFAFLSIDSDHDLVDREMVGYWDYDEIDGQSVVAGLVLKTQAGSYLGVTWQRQLELVNHEDLSSRKRQLWPVELHKSARKVCVNYPDYPRYTAFIDMPGESDDAVYLFGPCL